MSYFIYPNEEDSIQRVNIDELFDKKQRRDLRQVSVFNKILNRIHNRIKLTARNKTTDKHIWYNVPEYIFGEPLYDKGDCIAYIVSQLKDNGFFIKYIHPNTLFVSWESWVPAYVRNEIKKKKGIVLDEYGNILENKNAAPSEEQLVGSNGQDKAIDPKKKQYTPIATYKPTGNLVYNKELFDELEKKIVNL